MSPRGVAAFILLLAAAIGSFYFARSLSREDPEVVNTAAMQRGFYLRAARILGTGPDGSLMYEVEAEYAEQIGDDMIEMQNVRIIYSPESGVPWRLVADAATITRDMQLLMLEGHVVATTTDGPEGQETEIRSDYLELEPDRYRAETDTRVQIRIGSRSLTAIGMLASLDTDRLKLKSNVSGKFVP